MFSPLRDFKSEHKAKTEFDSDPPVEQSVEVVNNVKWMKDNYTW